ncbi:MAG: iron ABC transporter permease, partial [Prevotellaceae bacterium]|nr:iron ABC transporter permease [Prevotellaceae bacterium]
MKYSRIRQKYNSLFFIILTVLLIFLFVTDLTVGSVDISLKDVADFLSGQEIAASKILQNFRLPKACAAVFAGISLSVAGLQMQTVFRNPLADPYVLGVSSGAGLGVALFTMGISSFAVIEPLKNAGIYLAALAGSAAVLSLIMIVSTKVKDV